MGIKQSLKTGGGKSDYFSRETEQLQQMIRSLQCQPNLEGVQQEFMYREEIIKLEETEDTQDWEEFVKEIKTAFSDKSKAADVEWKIETFRQGKKHIANFMIGFNILAMKAETNEMYAIFLLKKNVQADIIKTILEYPPMVAPEMLKEWKIAITSVKQVYEFMEGRNDYKTSIGTTFGG